MSKKNRYRGPHRTDGCDPRGGRGNLCRTRPVFLPWGVASAVLRDGVLQSVEWERTREELEAALSGKFPGANVIDPGMCGAWRVLLAYSEGRPVAPETLAALRIAWDRVRGFQRTVLYELAGIPYGKTITYGALAARAGWGKAARAVGAAVSRNPWPVIVPCHRVVGAGGKMVGFGKGIAAKRTLLAFEEKNLAADMGCPRKRQIG